MIKLHEVTLRDYGSIINQAPLREWTFYNVSGSTVYERLKCIQDGGINPLRMEMLTGVYHYD